MARQIFKNDWQTVIGDELKKDYYLKLRQFLIYEYNHFQVFPAKADLFNALHLTAYDEVKVVILGQDPYHDERQAHGLSFSVQKGVKIPPSLANIYKELRDDLGIATPNHGDLTAWAKQGVLLLNAVLSVRAHQATSHRGQGWEKLTDTIISQLNQRQRPIVFILWGNFAKSKKALITNPWHTCIESVHPSPLAAHRGFFGSKPFSRANRSLIDSGQQPIKWQVINE